MKRLGQHFLLDQQALLAIAKALQLSDGETVIEIGPGHGELTKEIKNQIAKIKDVKVVVIEKDRVLAKELEMRNEKIEVITGDALKILPMLISRFSFPVSYKLVGNIPYYITGHLLRIIGLLSRKPKRCVFTIQKEVAERIVAQPPHMSRLAASVQFWAKPRVVASIPRTAFRPSPAVDSAIVLLELRNEDLGVGADDYYATVHMLFKQPRKTIGNNLREKLGMRNEEIGTILTSIGINPNDRPQNLSIENIVKIAAALNPKS